MIYNVSHRTTYSYAQPVSISHHRLHLLPRPTARQSCLWSSILVEPNATSRSEARDYFGNRVLYLTIQTPHDRLRVTAESRIEVQPAQPVALELSAPWDQVARELETARDPAALEAYQFAFDSPYAGSDEAVHDYARACFAPGQPVLSAAMSLTSRIFREFKYEGGVTDVSTPIREVLQSRRGVCQDFAHLEIACLRSHGVPARYVSGYLLTYPPEGQPKLVGADASHAWVAVWCPEYGWVDFDPTNDVIPGDEHITLGWGRDYGDVSPINGFMVGGGEHTVEVAVDVIPGVAA
jgi:transglutaminase-like putative cysteine protease